MGTMMTLSLCCQLLQQDSTDSASTRMQRLWPRRERDVIAAEKPRQKDTRRSHSVDSGHFLRPKTKSKTNKSPNRKFSKVPFVCYN